MELSCLFIHLVLSFSPDRLPSYFHFQDMSPQADTGCITITYFGYSGKLTIPRTRLSDSRGGPGAFLIFATGKQTMV